MSEPSTSTSTSRPTCRVPPRKRKRTPSPEEGSLVETRPGGGVDLFPRPPFRRVQIADARESSDTDEYESEDPERRSTRQPPVANPAQELVSTDDSSGDDASTSSWSEYEEEDLSTQRSPSPGTPTSSGRRNLKPSIGMTTGRTEPKTTSTHTAMRNFNSDLNLSHIICSRPFPVVWAGYAITHK